MHPRPWLLLPVSLLAGVSVLSAAAGSAAPASRRASAPFNFLSVERLAQRRASEPYRAADGPSVPGYLARLSYAAYQGIRFRPQRALWRNQGLFEVQFFQRASAFSRRVQVSEIVNGHSQLISYDPSMFDFGKLAAPRKLPADFGFAGLRVHYPLNRPGYKDEVISFLGASYFRLLGRGQVYGASARGLAVDVATPEGEEFPYFRHFWIVRPSPQQRTLTLYALLDSPSVSGAYSFVLSPSTTSQVKVHATLYLRKPIDKLGIAPLTSMFLYGEDRRGRPIGHFLNPEVHDSDGLLMQTGQGEWIWRPLHNPRVVRVSAFSDVNPRGFGLTQRDRNFADYQDEQAHYELRPSYWVAPLNNWGRGHVELVEIPSGASINDNIVAFWVPATAPRPHQPFRFSYLLSAYMHSRLWPPGGEAISTRSEPAAGPAGQLARRVAIDFTGGDLDGLEPSQPVRAQISAVNGSVDQATVQDLPQLHRWRVTFRFVASGKQAVDLRCYLTLDGEALTETWSDVWTP